MLNILNLIDDARCFETVRAMRWPQGVTCPHCHSPQITKQGRDKSQPERQKYECNACRKRFDDLTGTIFAGHHQPLRVWMLCLYFMRLNLSNEQIAHELDLNSDDAQKMTTQLREGIVERKPEVTLSGEVWGTVSDFGGTVSDFGGDGVRLCSWFLRAVFQTKNKV